MPVFAEAHQLKPLVNAPGDDCDRDRRRRRGPEPQRVRAVPIWSAGADHAQWFT